MRSHPLFLGIALLALVSAPFAAQTATAQIQVQRGGENPIYRITINVVERQIPADTGRKK